MEAAFSRSVWQGALALAMAGVCPATDAGIISGMNLPSTPLLRTNRVDDFEAVAPPSPVPAEELIVPADVAATGWSADGLSVAAGEFDVSSAAAAARQTMLLELVTGLSETGSHVVFPGGPQLEPPAGIDRGGGRRANAGAGGLGNAFSAGATGGGNARATSQRSASQGNSDDDSDESRGIPLTHDPSLLDSSSLISGLLTGVPATPPSLPSISPPGFEFPAPLQAIEPLANQVLLPEAQFATSAIVASEPTSFVIMGVGLSGFIGIGLTAYGIKTQGTTRRRGRRGRQRG